jgi:putative oxidoreductase
MSHVQSSPGQREPAGQAFGADVLFLRRFADPLVLVARAMLAYIFVVEGFGKIAHYADVGTYMRDHGVASALLPLVILTELGGGLLVLVGLKTPVAAIALAGFCLLTAVFFHLATGEMIEFQKNIAIAGGFLLLARFGPGAWSIDRWLGGDRPI